MMEIYKGELSDITRYLKSHDQIPLEDINNNKEMA